MIKIFYVLDVYKLFYTFVINDCLSSQQILEFWYKSKNELNILIKTKALDSVNIDCKITQNI